MKRNFVLTLILAVGLFLLTIGADCNNNGQKSENEKLKAELDLLKKQLQMNGYDGYHGGGHGESSSGLVSLTQQEGGTKEHLIASFKSLAKKSNWGEGYYSFEEGEKVNGEIVYLFPGHTCAGWFYVDDEENFRGMTLDATYTRSWALKQIKNMQNNGKISGGKLKPEFIATVISYMQSRIDSGW